MSKQTTTALARPISVPSPQTGEVIELKAETTSEQPSASKLQYMSNAALKVATHIVGSSGSGKSKLLAHIFVWNALVSEKPAIVFDPTGGVIDHLLGKLLRLPPKKLGRLLQRIRYINVGAKDFVFPSPLYYRLRKDDTFFEIANRFPSVIKRQDKHLQEAPILGWNPLFECAINAGEIAAALGRQIDFVADLVMYPGKHRNLLRQVVEEYPDLQPAVEYFRALMDPTSAGLREKKTGSFRNKLLPVLADPIRMATYAGKKNRRNWKKFLKSNQVILVDYREVLDQDNLQFDMVWDFKNLLDAIKQRGAAGRGHEVLLVIDEITSMLGQRTDDGHSILAEDLQELITRLGRAYGVNTVIAHQGLYQIDKRIQEVLMGMGNQIVGQLSSPDDAVRVARQFLRYDPYKVKKVDKVYGTITPPAILSFFGGPDRPFPYPIDKRTTEFTPEEQLLKWVNKILDLDRFQFLTQIATGEGGKKGRVTKITIANLDKNQYPQEEILAALRQQLTKRDGVPAETLLAEIRANQIRETPQQPNQQVKTEKKSARVNDSSTKSYDPPPDHLPVNTEPAAPVPAAGEQPGETREPDHEIVFR